MQRKFLTNLALLLSLNFLVKPFWIFGIDRTVQNVVGNFDYGFYFTILNFAFVFNILLDAGITNFNNRNIAQHHFLLNKHFSGIVVLKFILAVMYVLVIFSVALIIGYSREQMILLAWVGFNQFLLSFILYLRSNISGLLLFRTDSIISVLDRVLMIIICGVLLWGHVTREPFRIEWFVYAQTASYLLTALIAMLIVIRKARFKKLSWNLPFFLLILKKSFPFALLVLLMSIYNRVDTVFIERLLTGDLGDQQVGIYAHAYRILDAANQIALLFAVLLLPIYSRMIRLKQPVEDMVRLPFSILITGGIVLSIGSFFYSAEIMQLLYPIQPGEEPGAYAAVMQQSAVIYGLLMFCFLATSTMYVFSTLLTANGSLKQLNLVAFAGILVNFSLNIILIPEMMATGSAIASLVTQAVTAISHVFLVQWYFKFKINWKFISLLAFYTLAVILLSYLSRKLPFEWLINLGLMVVVSLAIAFSIRLVSLQSIWLIVKSREGQE
jgi:O-antigen/teichoic acid export membrane protein